MTLHENPVASVKYLLGNLLQNQNENKGISDRTKIRNLRELRTRLLSEDFRRAIIKLQHHSIIAGQPQKGLDLEEDVSWGNIIRDLVDIVEYECSSDSCVRERKLSIHREMADTLQAVVRVALEDMSGTIGEGKTFDSLFKDFILNALRFAFTSLKDTRRKVIHPNIWCLARDIFEYATILQFLGRKQIAKWYELCFESFKSIETIDITSRRLQLTTARQIVVILMKRGQLFELADATLLRKLIMATIQSFQDLHNNIVADDDGISFVISTLFHILYQRGIELDSEMLHVIDDVATNSAWNLLKERKWRPGIVGYLAVTSCLVPRRNHSMKTAAYLITEYSRQTLNSCEETSEYLSYLLCLPQLLDLWQKQELSPDFTTYLLTFKLQSSSTVLREICEQSELLDTLCTLFETTSVHEPTYRSREESKRDICVCCLHLVKLVSLYNEKFHISSAYKFFHISARHFNPANAEISTIFVLTCCFILHVPISGSRELQTDYYSKLYLEAAKILSNTELPIEVDLLVSAVYHFNSCFDDSFLHKYLKRNLSRIIASLNDLDYSLLIPFVDLVVTTIFSDVELHVPKSPKDCPFCISYCSRKSEFSILIDKIECVNDPIEHLNKTSLRNESLLWQIVTNEVSTAKEDLRFSERLGHSSTLIFVEELENCITNSRPTYLNVKLVYFISEILRILACRLNSSNVTLLQLKQIAQNLFLDAVVSFDSFVSPACSNSNDLYDIVFFAKSTATILSTDSILDWSAELVERIELLLKRALQVSNDFTSTLANDEVFSRTDFLCPSKKRRISSTKSFDLFYENADQGISRELISFLQLQGLDFSKLSECPSFICYVKCIIFLYFVNHCHQKLFYYNSSLADFSWKTNLSSFLESLDSSRMQSIIPYLRCYTCFCCNNEDYKYLVEELNTKLLKSMKNWGTQHTYRLSTPSNLTSLKLLLNYLRIILEEIQLRGLPLLDRNISIDILQVLKIVGSKFISSHGHLFLEVYYKLWMLIGARVYRFEEEELVEIFLQCFQLLWTRLSEGTLYNHCHYMVSMIEYCRQFDESVSDFILLSSIDSISQVPTLQDRFLIFLYFVARRTIHCLAHCCSVICCMAKTMQWKMLKHYLRKISMENGYYSLRYLFRQHSWSILYKWLQKEKKTLSEFSFDLFDWSFDLFQHSCPFESLLLQELLNISSEKSCFSIPSNVCAQELVMILLDSSLFQSDVNIRFPQIQNGRFEPPSSHILSGDIEGILTYLSNGRQSQCAMGTSEFSSLSLLELRFFLSRPKSDLNVSFQLFRWLESYSQCNKKDQSFFYLFLCLFFLLHLAEEHLMTKEFVCTMKKILNGLQDHISGMKLEDFILHQVLSCVLVRLNFLGLKSVCFRKMVSRFLTFLPNAVILQLDPPAMAPNEATNEALDLYYQTVFSSFRTWKEQLDFFVRVCTRSPPFSPVVVVARLQLLQQIVERNREIIQRKQTTDFTVQDLQAKCVAYLLFIVKDWLPFIAHDEIVPFDKTYICETSKRSLVLLFETVMYQVPSLFSLENWSQVGDCIIRVCFSKFLSKDPLIWTAAYFALCQLLKDKRMQSYMKKASYLRCLFNQEISSGAQVRNIMIIETSLKYTDFEELLTKNSKMDESLWLRQLVTCLLQSSCVESSILVYLRELCLASLELSVFLLPLVLMEFYLSENVYEWHRVRDGLIAMLDDGTCSSRLTVVLLESLDFIRSQCVNVNSLYAGRLGLQQQKEVTNVFDCLQLKIVANAAFRVKKYATAFFYYELALSYQCFGFVMNSEEANLRDRDNGNVQNLIESALCLSDADLAYAFPTFSNILDLFDSKHVHKLYDFTEESSQFEQNLRNLDQLLIATEKFPDQYDSQLKQNALYKIQSILIKSGLHYLADCVKGKAHSCKTFKEDMNTSFGAVKDLSEWGTYANEPFYPRHLTSEAVHSQPVSECIIPDTFHTWNLVENVSYESSKCISDMVLKLRLVSYKEELFPELQRSCFYEDDMKIELDTKTIRQLCAITLERKQFAEFVIWFRKYLDCSSRGSKRTFEKEAAFYDIVQLVENLWKPLTVILQENVDHSTNLLSCVFRLERAKLLYEKKEFDAAIQVVSTMLKSFPLENLTNFSSSNSNEFASVKVLLQTYIHASLALGTWCYEMHSESAKSIFENYLSHAKNICMNSQLLTETRCRSCYFLASFSDQVLSAIEGYENSAERRFESCLDKERDGELEKCKELAKQSTLTRSQKDELSRHIRSLQKEIEHSKARLQATREDCDFWLKCALENYAQCLLSGDQYNLIGTFRFIDLWMNNNLSKEVNTYVISLLECENTALFLRKFRPLIYQLSSRLDMKDNLFCKVVYKFIFEMAKMYPHDCLWQLLALSNGDRIPHTQKGAERFAVDISKKEAAAKILKQLYPFHKKLITQMMQLSDGYLELSEFPVDSQCEFSTKSLMLGSISDFGLVRVPSVLNNFRSNNDHYQNEPFIALFREKFHVAGGINHPKIIVCLGSDGKEYKQLVKGSDDLRQDAIMQQLFQISNQLLFMSQPTRSRRLLMRTYNVLPLSPCAGVVQWVEGTIPLGTYLIGATGSEKDSAHYRFRPQDWLSVQCRKKLRDAPDHLKLEVFNEICQKFQPVFRYFFLEYFQIPSQCLQRRLAYTRSVAASSIIGYLIGLGDRHCSNILLDVNSAEIVHIDFGIAFEQGRMLRTPERVPFRLTRDIMDGMGCYGVEGPFRRSCEATLKVLQEYKKILLTVIKVFLHDPLFRWALSPLKAFMRQSKVSSNASFLQKKNSFHGSDDIPEDANAVVQGNSEAARALLRVQEKLSGYLQSEQVDTRTHVRRLINDAKNIEFLCKMFEGWAPWV